MRLKIENGIKNVMHKWTLPQLISCPEKWLMDRTKINHLLTIISGELKYICCRLWTTSIELAISQEGQEQKTFSFFLSSIHFYSVTIEALI